MNTERFRTVVGKINNICSEINNREDNTLEYVVLQGLDKNDPYLKDPFILYKIADFYNYNWLGNVDFMHIPEFEQIMYNSDHYPIIIAREKDTKEIVGISTLKYEENTKVIEDPYYPISQEKYFSITGILTKRGNPHRGIGKKIYEIALRGHYEFNKIYQDTSIMCVIDCRNKNSLNALHYAADKLNENVEEDMTAKVSGYYILTDEDENMLEAPTMVLKVEEDSQREDERSVIEYSYKEDEDLFDSLLNSLRQELTDVSEPIVNLDEDAGIVSYYHVRNYHNLPKVISNGTEMGNDREKHEDTKSCALCRVRTFKR